MHATHSRSKAIRSNVIQQQDASSCMLVSAALLPARALCRLLIYSSHTVVCSLKFLALACCCLLLQLYSASFLVLAFQRSSGSQPWIPCSKILLWEWRKYWSWLLLVWWPSRQFVACFSAQPLSKWKDSCTDEAICYLGTPQDQQQR